MNKPVETFYLVFIPGGFDAPEVTTYPDIVGLSIRLKELYATAKDNPDRYAEARVFAFAGRQLATYGTPIYGVCDPTHSADVQIAMYYTGPVHRGEGVDGYKIDITPTPRLL